ncbi:hypothetical protein ACFL2U_01600 [Patescibacteria group bacterium]
MSDKPKVIILRTDYEALQKGEKVEDMKIFNSRDDIPDWMGDTPNAFLVEVELDLTRSDVVTILFK